MCLDCGCHKPSDSHGDARHITLQDVQKAAEASGISTQEAADRIAAEVKRAVERRMLGATPPQSPEPPRVPQ